jgi:HD-like signal output (HDOD) protein
MFLGMDTVMGIVNALCLRNSMLAGHGSSDELMAVMNRFWDSAIDVAQACVLVAQKLRLPVQDQVYTLGLFHNVAIPLLMQKHGNYPEVMREAYANPTPRIVDVENRHFDSNHAVVGYFVARSWGLSPELCDAIAQHHNLDYITGGDNDQNETQQCLQVLKIAEHIAGLYRVLGDQAVDKEWEQAGQNILVSIGMSEYEYEDVVAQARELGLGEQQYFC